MSGRSRVGAKGAAYESILYTHECFRNHHLNKSAILLSRVLSEKGNFRLAYIAITNLSDAASGFCII